MLREGLEGGDIQVDDNEYITVKAAFLNRLLTLIENTHYADNGKRNERNQLWLKGKTVLKKPSRNIRIIRSKTS